MKTTLYLIRHGESLGNLKDEFQGIIDEPLSEKGMKQVQALGERSKTWNLDAIYASPLKRAIQTAEGVNRHYQYPVRQDPRLREISLGHWEGIKRDLVPDLFPEEYRNWKEKPWCAVIEGGDSMEEVYRRMVSAITEIVRDNRGKNVAVVSHGGAMRHLFCWLLSIPHEQLEQTPLFTNTSVSKIEFDELDAPQIVYSNDDSHLTEELKHPLPADFRQRSYSGK